MLPLTKDEIIAALKTLKAWPLLNGYRGSAILVTDKLIDALHAILYSALIMRVCIVRLISIP